MQIILKRLGHYLAYLSVTRLQPTQTSQFQMLDAVTLKQRWPVEGAPNWQSANHVTL
jgi:hypothetical protein